MRGGLNKKVIGVDSLKIKIGKNNEINNVLSLRPKSVDSLVVFWSQLGC